MNYFSLSKIMTSAYSTFLSNTTQLIFLSQSKSNEKSDTKTESKSETAHIIHVSNLVRPYALSQLKQLLSDLGSFQDNSFWIDNIKSHCFVSVSI